MQNVLLLDNYDSFTWNLAQILDESGLCDFDVKKNDEITVEEAGVFDKILLSPGPGLPYEAGILKSLIKALGYYTLALGWSRNADSLADPKNSFLRDKFYLSELRLFVSFKFLFHIVS